METRAPFIIVGTFVLAAIGALFGFVYWLHNAAGTGARTVHHVQFDGSVSGLLVGAAVLFNGMRVGEVTALGLEAGSPRRVDATIAVTRGTPVDADTKGGLDFQGLTGVPVIALEGGTHTGAINQTQTLIADPAAGQSMTQAARNALTRVDTVLAENADALKSTIGNLKIFSEGLARNTGKLDGIVVGLERMTGGGEPPAVKTIYDLTIPKSFAPAKPIATKFTMPVPTAILLFDTQRFLFAPSKTYPDFANAQWADSIPKLLQARLIQSFENYDVAQAPLRANDNDVVGTQILIDIRHFQIATEPDWSAEIGFSARILDKDGKVVASKIFEQTQKLAANDPPSAVVAFDKAFAKVSADLIVWTADAL